MPIFSQIPPKTKEWHPLKYPGTGPFSPVRIFKAVAWQSCSQAIYPKIWENLLIYYLGKVKKFEKHRMIESILKNVISVVWANMPPPGFFRVKLKKNFSRSAGGFLTLKKPGGGHICPPYRNYIFKDTTNHPMLFKLLDFS